MKTIAIMNQKGGIGKTMTAASIAYLLGEEQGKKVLLVDADQQGNVSMLYDRYKPEGIGMSELLERHRSVGGSYKTTDLIQTKREMHSGKVCFLYSRKRIGKRRRIRKKGIGQTRPEQNLMKKNRRKEGKAMKNKFNFSRRNPKTKKIENTGFMEFRNVSNNAADLYIYGDIVSSTWEAWCDEDTCPQDISDFMNQIEPGAELTVYINSGGGDVFAGIAIHSILSRHTGHKTGIVDGMAASIASVILMACDSIVMSSGAQIMIHKPLSWAYGNADDFQRLISELDKCQKSITDIYMGRVKEGVTEEQVTDLINAETWMTAEEAKEIFDVQIEERPAVAACVGWMMENFKKAPEGIKTQSADDVTAKITAEEEAIIEEMELFGI